MAELYVEIFVGLVGFVPSPSVDGKRRTRPAVVVNVRGDDSHIECLLLDSVARASSLEIELDTARKRALRLGIARYSTASIRRSHFSNRIGKVSHAVIEAILREKARAVARDYYFAVHEPKNKSKFVPGISRISYAGRVFDEKELVELTDSTLDFWLTAGRFVEKFEKDFARKLGVRCASLVNSGSSANLVAFASLTSSKLADKRIRRGDEVITVAAGFPTTINPALQYGARPVFVDICVNDGTYNIDCAQLEAAFSERTKAVMIAHTLGNPFNLEKVGAFCKKHNLWLVEDNCDALGSTYQGKLTGTFGDIATSSFYPPHHMTMGEGGAVYTNKAALKTIVESFRDWGRDCWCASGKDNTCGKRFLWELGTLPKAYDHKFIYSHLGYNLKVTEMQAAIGCAQLEKLDSFVSARRANWKFLRTHLSHLAEFFVLPEPTDNSDPSWFGFLLTLKPGAPFTRDTVVKYLESRNIQTRMLFAGNFTRQPCFDEYRADPDKYRIVGDLKNTDRVMRDTFWIGVYPGLTQEMLSYMVEVLSSIARDPSIVSHANLSI